MLVEYRVNIYSKDNVLEKVLFYNDASVKSFNETINKGGSAVFSIKKESQHAIKDNFTKYKRVKIFRFNEDTSSFDVVFSGFIETILQNGEEGFEIGCVGVIDLFKKRLGSLDVTSSDGGTEALGLLTTTNTADDTKITVGTSDYDNLLDKYKADNKPIFDIWTDIAKNEDDGTGIGEFEIVKSSDVLNFKKSLGSDKTATVVLKYDEDNPQYNNINRTNIEESGIKLVNKIYGIGKSSGGTPLTYTGTDSGSIAIYGLLEEQKSYDSAEDAAQLQALVDGDLQNMKEEISNNDITALTKEIVPTLSGTKTVGLDLFDIELGDTITLMYNTTWISFTESRRIVSISVSIDNGGNEEISLKLNKIDQNLSLTEEISSIDEISQRQRAYDNRIYK